MTVVVISGDHSSVTTTTNTTGRNGWIVRVMLRLERDAVE